MVIKDGLLDFLNRIHNKRPVAEHGFVQLGSGEHEHAHRIVEIAPDSPLGYERLADLNQYESGRMDEAIKWRHKAARID